jgi:hypothetical protein
MIGGWVQIMGPVERVAQFKQIELALPRSNGLPGAELQQQRWPAATSRTRAEALSRLFVLPGSRYSDPEFSWKFAVPDPPAIGFLASRALGPQYDESESLLFGSGFGVGTDIKTGPNGNLYVVSLTQGAVYEIFPAEVAS